MKPIIKVMLLAGTTMAATGGAFAQSDDRYEGWYVGGELGFNSIHEEQIQSNNFGLTGDVDHDIGPTAAVFVGYGIERWRLEAAARYRTADFSTFDVLNAGGTGLPLGRNLLDGSVSSQNFDFTALYELGSVDDFRFWAGAGVGLTRLEVDNLRASGALSLLDDSEWTVSAHAVAQLSHEIDDNLEFSLGYRYFVAADQTFASSLGPLDYGHEGHEVFARLTFLLGDRKPARRAEPTPRPEPAPAPTPARTAAPTPPPPPAPVIEEPAPAPEPEPVVLPGPFLIFFDFDSDSLTDAGQRIVTAAATAYKNGEDIQIALTGHADRSGPTGYNLRLSERRAQVVQSALIAAGVERADISWSAKGESDPLIATDDGVREPQNRRVELVLSN